MLCNHCRSAGSEHCNARLIPRTVAAADATLSGSFCAIVRGAVPIVFSDSLIKIVQSFLPITGHTERDFNIGLRSRFLRKQPQKPYHKTIRYYFSHAGCPMNKRIAGDAWRNRFTGTSNIPILRAETYTYSQYGRRADVCFHESKQAFVAEVQSYRCHVSGRQV